MLLELERKRSVAISWIGRFPVRIARNTVIYSLNNCHELQRLMGLGIILNVSDCGGGEKKIAKIYMFEFISWLPELGKFSRCTNTPTALASLSSFVCRNCLIKQANMAKAKQKFACLSVFYAKISNLIKQIYGREMFYSFLVVENMKIFTSFCVRHPKKRGRKNFATISRKKVDSSKVKKNLN